MVRELTFAISADYERATGGWVYDQRLLEGLTRLGWRIHRLTLPPGFPHPSPAARTQVGCRLSRHRRRLTRAGRSAVPRRAAGGGEGRGAAAAPRHGRASSAGAGGRAITRREPGLCPIGARGPAARRRRDRHVARNRPPPRRRLWRPHRADHRRRPRRRSPTARPRQRQSCAQPFSPSAPSSRARTTTPSSRHSRASGTCPGGSPSSATRRARRRTLLASAQAIAASALSSRVFLTGELSARALARRWQTADLYVAASRHEGYGMAIAEALCPRPAGDHHRRRRRRRLDRPPRRPRRAQRQHGPAQGRPCPGPLHARACARELRRGALARRRALPTWEATAEAVHRRLLQL